MADEEKNDAVAAADALATVMDEELGVNSEFVDDTSDKAADTDTKTDDAATADTDVEKVADAKPGDTKTDTPQVDDSLLERAVKAGIPLAKAKGFTSENLEAAVEALESAKPETKADAEEKKEAEKVTFDDLLDEGFDPRLVERLNKVAGRIEQLEQEKSQLKQNLEQLSQRSSSQAEQDAIADFDGRISALGEDFKEVFGEGSLTKLDRGSTPHKLRTEVLEEMGSMAAGYQAVNKPVPDIDTLFKRAVFNVTGKTPTAQAAPKEDPIPGKLAAQAGKTVGRPASTTKQNTPAGELSQSLRELEDALGR